MDEARFQDQLRALANPARIQLLRALETPRHPAEIRLAPSQATAGLRPDRVVSRPGVIQHLQVLERCGLVQRVDDRYVVDQQAMFSLLSDLGGLARLQPMVEVDIDETIESGPTSSGRLPLGPRLVIVGGPRDGVGFALEGDGPWHIGRSASSEIRLEYDPHVSRIHLRLHRTEKEHRIDVLQGVKNPVKVDDMVVPPGTGMSLRPGAVVSVGASRLVFQ